MGRESEGEGDMDEIDDADHGDEGPGRGGSEAEGGGWMRSIAKARLNLYGLPLRPLFLIGVHHEGEEPRLAVLLLRSLLVFLNRTHVHLSAGGMRVQGRERDSGERDVGMGVEGIESGQMVVQGIWV